MLAIAGGKGGCGKTTTTLGLAAALADNGYEPLVIDGDCDMPDIHHRLGVRNTGSIDALARGDPLHSVVDRAEKLPGVGLVYGGRRNSLGSALQRARRWNGPVLVDCGAGTNPDAVSPLRHAERALIVSTPQPYCIEDAETTRQIAGRLSTAVTGVVVRESRSPSAGPSQSTASDSRRFPGHWTILGKLPYASAPLQSPQLGGVFERVAKAVYSSPGGPVGEKPSQQRRAGSNRLRDRRRNI